MITVAIHPDRQPAATEFFELFKTEWKMHTPGTPCDILLTDGTVRPDDATRLCLIFSPQQLLNDKRSPPAETVKNSPRLSRLASGEPLPLYTSSRLFETVEHVLLRDEKTGRALAYIQEHDGRKIIRVGYDLFAETAYLLTVGQPPENAGIPALDHHITFLRTAIIQHSGQPLIEIPPSPPGHPYMVCLTHDVDFAGIRNHGCDRTFWGFAYRAMIGSWQRLFKRRISWKQLFINYCAVLSLPLVHLGLCKDFWMQFDRYRRLEEPYRSTFFLIPFKNRPGQNVRDANPELRATRYDIADILDDVTPMLDDGWEFGLHGIDAWHDAAQARQERARIDSLLKDRSAGIRMHWLCRDENTDLLLDEAGFEFDSTCGYNETIGFRAGTSQVFRPIPARRLLEVPLHIQDAALFYPAFLDLDQKTAQARCKAIMEHPRNNGGVLTLLWHMRSVAPERLWGDFYKWLIDEATRHNAWFGTARETADWFRGRRQLSLSSRLSSDGELIICLKDDTHDPKTRYRVRVHRPACGRTREKAPYSDIVWSGQDYIRSGIYEQKQEEPRMIKQALA